MIDLVGNTPTAKHPARPKARARTPVLEGMCTLAETASKLGVSEATIFRRIKEGIFHPIRDKGKGRKLLFHPHEIEEEIERVREIHEKGPGGLPVGRPPNRPPILIEEQAKKEQLPSEPKLPESKASIAINSSEPEDSSKKRILNPARDGAMCAKAVSLFRQEKTVLDIVVEMEVDFETANYFWECYTRLQPGWFLPQKQFVRVRTLLDWHETPPTPEGFAHAFNTFVAKELDRLIKSKGITNENSGENGIELTESERKELAAMESGPTDDE